MNLFKKHYFELDLIRSAAIIMVIVGHLYDMLSSLLVPVPAFYAGIFAWGSHGVELFFVLSGFLIGGQIIEDNLNGTFDFKRFYIKRFWRIFPPYYFCIFIVVMANAFFTLLHPDFISVKTILIHLAYLQNYFSHGLQNGIYWTLAVEEQFYILIPFLLWALIKFNRNNLFASLITLTLLGSVIRLLLYDPSKNWFLSFRDPFHARFDTLLFGVAAAYLFITYKEKLERLSAPGKLFLLAVPALCLLTSFFKWNTKEIGYFEYVWEFTLTGLGFSAIILYLVLFPVSSIVPAFVQKAAAWIAKLSYSMYLYHLLALRILMQLLHENFKSAEFYSFFTSNPFLPGFLALFFIYFVALLAAAGFFYWLIDIPCMEYRRKILMKGNE